MNVVSKEEFFSLIKKPREERIVCIDGMKFRIRELTELLGIEYEKDLAKHGKYDIYRSRRAMVAMCVIDSDGNQIVTNSDDLMESPLGLINRLHDECLDLNRYQKDEVEEAIKNSEPAVG